MAVQIVQEYLSGLVEEGPLKDVFAAKVAAPSTEEQAAEEEEPGE